MDRSPSAEMEGLRYPGRLTEAALGKHPDVKAVLWEAHDVAEDVRDRRRQKRASAEEEICAMKAEEARIRELEHCGLVGSRSRLPVFTYGSGTYMSAS